MKGSHCRLYDENLVRNIMISTGISIVEYLKDKKSFDIDEVCEFVEFNADEIISETIKNLNSGEEQEKGERIEGANADQTPLNEENEDTSGNTW